MATATVTPTDNGGVKRDFFEQCGDAGAEVETFSDPMTKHDFATLKYDVPFVVRTSWVKDMASASDEDQGNIRMQHVGFESQFSKWDRRAVDLRAGRKVAGEGGNNQEQMHT